jgi:integrase
MLFVRLHEKGPCLYNPCDRIKLGSGKGSSEGKPAFVDQQRTELKDVLSAEAPQLWLLVQFMFYTFVRPKELRFAKVGDIQGNKLQVKDYSPRTRKRNTLPLLPNLCGQLPRQASRTPPSY